MGVKIWSVGSSGNYECQSTLTGHSIWVRCVAFDPQKPNILASCSDDKTIKIWNIESGACQSTLTGHSDSVFSVCFISDGKQIASGSWDTTVKIWNASSGELQSTLAGHSNRVRCVAFDPQNPN